MRYMMGAATVGALLAVLVGLVTGDWSVVTAVVIGLQSCVGCFFCTLHNSAQERRRER